MKKLVLSILVFALMLTTYSSLKAQLRTPAPSPAAKVMQTVGLTDVTIEYSRPGVKDRTIFAADGLVPFGETWRTGANAATKFTFSEDVMLAGEDLEAGSYAVLTVPTDSEWKFMLYPYESGSWSSYLEKEPAAAFSVKTQKTKSQVESFTIGLSDVSGQDANIYLKWENTKVVLPLAVHTEKQVNTQFEKMLAGPSDQDYFAMGTYLHNQGEDLDKALKYVRKVTAKDDARFWQLRREALILADMKEYSEAIKVAEKSLADAQKSNNNDYIRMNKASIAEWSKMAKGEMPTIKKAKPMEKQ